MYNDDDLDIEITGGVLPSGSSIAVRKIDDCKKRLFEENDLIEDEHSYVDDITTIKETNRKKQKLHTIDVLSNKKNEFTRYHRTIPNKSFVVLTSHSNERFYLELNDDDNYKSLAITTNKTQSLLKISIDELMDQHVRKKLDEISAEVDNIIVGQQGKQLETNDLDFEEKELWVDKFAPKDFCELLSDIGINRTLLEWLKLWDYLVFNKDLSHFRQLQNRQYNQKENNNSIKQVKKSFFPSGVQYELDSIKRPQQKVALLCGSPGSGKTTLAQIVARHAGYNIIEMNASDDRSIEAFRTRIESSTQMREILNKTYRPNCLLIDEIDGAPTQSIQLLVDLINREHGTTTKNSKNNSFMLYRPIICICNDLYVPALKSLRQIALILHFPRIDHQSLAKRLMIIAQQSNITADLSAITSLCLKSVCDVRSCLHFMQFVAKCGTRIDRKLVDSSIIGVKDSQKSMFEVWNEILQAPSSKTNQTSLVLEDPLIRMQKKNSTTVTRRLQLIEMISNLGGGNDRLYDGLFENYLTINHRDRKLSSLAYANSWLLFYDILNKEVYAQQNYFFWQFLPYTALTFHLLFASNQPVQIKYPQKQVEMNTKHRTYLSSIETMLEGIKPSLRQYINSTTLVLDILPYMIEILQPRLRPTNMALFTAKEKDDIKTLIDVMITYNLSYTQQRLADGAAIVLEPPVDAVALFAVDQKQRNTLSFSCRQMISKELTIEKVKRHIKIKPNSTSSATKIVDKITKSHVSTVSHKVEPKLNIPITNTRKDFFAKFKLGTKESTNTRGNVTSTENQTGTNILVKIIEKPIITFQYNEGFSDAVRCRVKMQDLL